VTRHVWEGDREAVDSHRQTAAGKAIYKRRKETIERSFADAKQLHGHRYMRMRGLLRAKEQCLLSAACQNMKKMALLAEREAEKASAGLKTLLSTRLKSFQATLMAIWPSKTLRAT